MKNFNIATILLLLLSGLILFSACSDDSSSSNDDPDVIAVIAVNPGSDDFDLQAEGEQGIFFCYEGEGCESGGGGFAFYSVFGGGDMDLENSSSSKTAVGVIVDLEITGGSGYFEIVAGFVDDEGWLEFDLGNSLYTSDVFSEGDTAQFSWGTTD